MDVRYTLSIDLNKCIGSQSTQIQVDLENLDLSDLATAYADDFTVCSDVTSIWTHYVQRVIVATLSADFMSQYASHDQRDASLIYRYGPVVQKRLNCPDVTELVEQGAYCP